MELHQFKALGQNLIYDCTNAYIYPDDYIAVPDLHRKKEHLYFQKDLKSEPIISGITLLMTECCNMRCRYCYEDHTSDNSHKIMQIDDAKSYIDFGIGHSDPKNPFLITFFGGEPFLCWDTISEIIQYANSKQKNVIYAITTNGTIISDEILRCCRNNSINLTISMDGSEETHNRNRTFIDGSETYTSILHNIELMTAAGIQTSVNSVLSKGVSGLVEQYKLVKKLGCKMFVMTPVSSDNPQLQLSQYDIERIKEDSEEICKIFLSDILENRPYMIPDFLNNLLQIFPQNRRSTYCGAAVDTVAVDPQGNVVPCHRFFHSNTKIGQIQSLLDFDLLKYQNYILMGSPPKTCENCWACNICLGGCYYDQKMLGNGSRYHTLLCTLRRRWIELAIASYSYIMKTAPYTINRLLTANLSKQIRYIATS